MVSLEFHSMKSGTLLAEFDSKYLNTVSDTRSVRVRFSVSENEYLDFRKRIECH